MLKAVTPKKRNVYKNSNNRSIFFHLIWRENDDIILSGIHTNKAVKADTIVQRIVIRATPGKNSENVE
jgi:hypothetical protein